MFSFLIIISLLNYTLSQFLAPIRFDTAIDKLRHYRHVNLADLSDHVDLFENPVHHLRLFSDANATTQCQADVRQILQALQLKQTWAIKVIDAWGKPLPSGVLKGNTFWIGNYDECVGELYQSATKSYLKQPISTQHCTVIPPTTNSSSPLSIVLGICVPSSCNRTSIVEMIDSIFVHENVTESNLICSGDPPNGEEGLTLGAIIIILVIIVLVLIVLFGTLIDLVIPSASRRTLNEETADNHGETKSISLRYIDDHNSDRLVWLRFVSEFSALRSLSRIFTMTEKRNDETFRFIHGIRVLSLFWVIIGHSIAFSLSFSSNPIDVLSWSRNIFFQLVTNAVFSVDTFFVLSGFLTAILFVRQVEQRGALSFPMMILYYVHRYIRLTPAFFLVVLVSINLTPYFGYGPYFPTQQGFETAQCRSHYWWTSLLYISNFLKSDYMCLPITWYLHNDMQFHWIAPITLVPFVLKRKPVAILLAIALVLTSVASTLGLILSDRNIALSTLGEFGGTAGATYFEKIYVTPWCRISPYAIGILAGYLVHEMGPHYRLGKFTKYFGTISSILIALGCIFANYPDNILSEGLSRTFLVVYQSICRPLWSMAIAWLLVICSTNQGGLVNRILSWSIWTPFARLNYSCYLIHSTIISISIFNQMNPIYFHGITVMNNITAHISFSYLAAILVTILFETPFFIIEKRLFKR